MDIGRKLMLYRQKLLLALLQIFGGTLDKQDFQKYLFLFTEEYHIEKSYDFIPYQYGCFSFQSYADIRNLIKSGCLKENKYFQIIGNLNHLDTLKLEDKQKLFDFNEQYKKKKGNLLIADVYKKYPYYAINSKIAKEIFSKNELKKLELLKPKFDDFCFFTIGYEKSSFEHYLNRLIKNNIRLLCDVRKNPISRKYGFSKNTLATTLKKLNIEYVHFPELGIASEKRQNLETENDYFTLFKEYEVKTLPKNQHLIFKLLELLLSKKRIAITCFEADYHMCHRNKIVNAMTKLPEWRYEIHHI